MQICGAITLFAQRHALADAEAVLLGQFTAMPAMERDMPLEQRVGADNDIRLARSMSARIFSRACLELPVRRQIFDAQRFGKL